MFVFFFFFMANSWNLSVTVTRNLELILNKYILTLDNNRYNIVFISVSLMARFARTPAHHLYANF